MQEDIDKSRLAQDHISTWILITSGVLVGRRVLETLGHYKRPR